MPLKACRLFLCEFWSWMFVYEGVNPNVSFDQNLLYLIMRFYQPGSCLHIEGNKVWAAELVREQIIKKCLTPLQLETLQLSSHCRTFRPPLYVSYEVCVRSLLNSFFFFSNKMQLAVVFRENGECLFSTTRPETVILV